MAYDSSSFKPQVDAVTQIILDARALLSDPEKWFKGDYVCDATGAVCILGAMGVRSDVDLRSESLTLAAKRIAASGKAMFGPEFFAIPDFNDAPTTTHEMVLDLLDRAASPTKEA